MAPFRLCGMNFLTGFAAGTIWHTVSGGCGSLSGGHLGGCFFFAGHFLGGLCSGACALLKMAGVAAFAKKSGMVSVGLPYDPPNQKGW